MESDPTRAWQESWLWLCRRRKHAPVHADIWDLWFHWPNENEALYARVVAGQYRLSPLLVHRNNRTGTSHAVWSSRDALVLKWVSLVIRDRLPVHENCVHVAGHGGGRDSLRNITERLANGARYVYRTDIRGYYRHIRKTQLYHLVCRYITDPILRDLIYQYLYYSVEDGGEIHTPELGISRGCALSPLFGATLLHYVDCHFTHEEGLFYVRYMDDFLFLSERRWPIRRSRTKLLDLMDQAGFVVHPDKTQVGYVSKGFDWLGVWFTDQGPTCIAPRALENHRLRQLRLEEQLRREGLNSAAIEERRQQYVKRWRQWAEERLTVGMINPC